MASSSVLGSPQTIQKPNGSTYKLHDPFLSTILDFIRRALDQLARALNVVVVHTFKYHGGIGDRDEFFKGRDGEFVNPSSHHSGHDVYYLLSNLKHHASDIYASTLDNKDLTGTVEFLLQTIRNHIAHQSYLGCERKDDFATNPHCSLRKYSTVQECLNKCTELLLWFMNAPFYEKVRAEVEHIQTNLTNMKIVVADHKEAMERAESQASSSSDTDKAKDFLNKLLLILTDEKSKPKTFQERPVTHAINMILAPRIQRK